jgi:hypothetical protein
MSPGWTPKTMVEHHCLTSNIERLASLRAFLLRAYRLVHQAIAHFDRWSLSVTAIFQQ